jgi:hypothetical protein
VLPAMNCEKPMQLIYHATSGFSNKEIIDTFIDNLLMLPYESSCSTISGVIGNFDESFHNGALIIDKDINWEVEKINGARIKNNKVEHLVKYQDYNKRR